MQTWVQSLVQELRPHMLWVLTTAADPVLWSPRAMPTEPTHHTYKARQCPKAHALQQKKLPQEAQAPTKEQPMFTAIRESPSAATRTQHSQK